MLGDKVLGQSIGALLVHIMVWDIINELFYKTVFDGYLFIPYFIVQHNRIRNFKIVSNLFMST
jgi:hypothetical protein